MTDDAITLEELWTSTIPLTRALNLRVVECTDASVVTAAPLEPNVNLHGTGFAGSLYAICALTGWGLTWRLGRGAGLEGDIVLRRAEVDYLRPVTGEIRCSASVDSDASAAFLDALAAGRPGRLRVRCEIPDQGARAVGFSGDYHFRPVNCTGKGQ